MNVTLRQNRRVIPLSCLECESNFSFLNILVIKVFFSDHNYAKFILYLQSDTKHLKVIQILNFLYLRGSPPLPSPSNSLIDVQIVYLFN